MVHVMYGRWLSVVCTIRLLCHMVIKQVRIVQCRVVEITMMFILVKIVCFTIVEIGHDVKLDGDFFLVLVTCMIIALSHRYE